MVASLLATVGTTTGADSKPVRLAVTTTAELLVLAGSQIVARAPTGGIAAVAVHPTRPLMYVAPENGPRNGRLLTYALTSTGLALKSEVRLAGTASVHIAVAGSSEFLVVSHYVNGRASVVPLRADGLPSSKSPATLTIGSGAGSRIHGSVIAPNNRGVWMTDTGRDELITVTLDAKLRPVARLVTMLTKGSGPRSLALSKDAPHLVVSNEYSNSVSCFPRVDSGTALGLPTTIALGSSSEGRPADIVAGSGGAVMANRGPDEIVSLAVGSNADGSCSLEITSRVPSGGDSPRPLVAMPAAQGQGWCVGNEGSGEIVCTGGTVVANVGRPWGMAKLAG